MQVHKFGGASLQDAGAVKNVRNILTSQVDEPSVLVFSAMAKTTNALEGVIYNSYQNESYLDQLQEIHQFHLQVALELNPDNPDIRRQLDAYFDQIREIIDQRKPETTYDEYYDQVIVFGELLSTFLVHAYLNDSGIPAELQDARELIRTNDVFRSAKVEWEKTTLQITDQVNPGAEKKYVITQGFIAGNGFGKSTTLGREGSDFTASIFAFALNANAVTIWKDVPGILNADPALVNNTVKYNELNYDEVAEMAYYGAKVIHPETIRPLAMKKIPLYVKSFQKPQDEGTLIHDCQLDYIPPNIILKQAQCLISFNMQDYSFISEKSLSVIFHMLDLLNLKINMMQVSALSFSICIDYEPEKVQYLVDSLEKEFNIRYNTSLRLLTIKNYDVASLEKFAMDKVVLMEQRTRHNYQVVIR